MSDLIDRESVMEIILMPQSVSIIEQLEMLKKLPSAEPKTGKWIKENVVFTSNPLQYRWHCSECGTLVYGFSSGILTPYCHNCGARMEVEG